MKLTQLAPLAFALSLVQGYSYYDNLATRDVTELDNFLESRDMFEDDSDLTYRSLDDQDDRELFIRSFDDAELDFDNNLASRGLLEDEEPLSERDLDSILAELQRRGGTSSMLMMAAAADQASKSLDNIEKANNERWERHKKNFANRKHMSIGKRLGQEFIGDRTR